MVGPRDETPQRGYFDGMLVRHLWAVVAVLSVQVFVSVGVWAGRCAGAPRAAVAWSWIAYVGAVVVTIASLVAALGPLRRARDGGSVTLWVVASLALLAAAIGLAIVPTQILPAH